MKLRVAISLSLLLHSACALAQTPALNRAAQTVRTEVESWGANSGLATEYLYALSAMNYVQSRLSSANYAALLAQGKLPPNLDAEQCLTLEAGLCGSHVDAFDKVLAACTVPVRRRAVEWYLHDEKARNNRNHVAAEVFYHSRWHLFDVTSCTVFPTERAKKQDDLLSVQELMAAAKAGSAWRGRAVSNAAAVWNRQALAGGYDPVENFSWTDVDVLYGRRGTIHLRPDPDGTKYSLSNLLTLVGHTIDYCGNVGDVNFVVDPHALGKDRRELEIVANNVGDVTSEASLTVRDGSAILQRVKLEAIQAGAVIRVPIPADVNPLTILVESAQEKGYVDLRSVTTR